MKKNVEVRLGEFPPELENTGEIEGTYHAALKVNGVVVDTRDISLTL